MSLPALPRSPAFCLALWVGAASASLILALCVGSVALSPAQVWAALMGGATDPLQAVVTELRLPRALAAFVTGGLLALAGTLLQVLVRNPLADPYVLGVSGGAATGALAAMLLGWATVAATALAWGGALLSLVAVYVLARGAGAWDGARLLLTGVVVASGWGAVIALMLALSPEERLRGMLFWLMGDLAGADMPVTGFIILATGLALAYALARPLNVLAHGDLQAAALGVSVARLRGTLFWLAALLTACAVTGAGTVGFVGLVVPHLVRLLSGADHRVLLPAATLAGGTLLTLADTAARTLLAPAQLPVGAVTALVGVPVFLYLLRRGGR